MTAKQVNEALKRRIGYSKDEEIDGLRKVYGSIIKEENRNEEDFYWSVINWFFDGSTGAGYYDYWLKNNWK